MTAAGPTLPIVLHCSTRLQPRVRYALDTLLLAADIRPRYVAEAPASGPWLLYARSAGDLARDGRCLHVLHSDSAWSLFDTRDDVAGAAVIDGVPVVLAQRSANASADIAFDLPANAFYFLSGWSERVRPVAQGSRRLFSQSVFHRLGLPQDIVDRYLERLLAALEVLRGRCADAPVAGDAWPVGCSHAVVLSHDVDYLPQGRLDTALQGAKTFARHLLRQRDPADALRSAGALGKAWWQGRDPYGCVHEMLAREQAMGVRASYQVAVAHRHPADVNYRVEDDDTRDYLRAILDAGFDLCLHGSYRSTENSQWYEQEVALLTKRLARPLGSRQHFLSFDPDRLFATQERCGIAYDMSMGYPDQPGPRAGFSHPYFPYCIDEDRPYRVLQISLVLMDVTLRAYLGLRPHEAWPRMVQELDSLRRRRGGASVVWHPIVFAGARDPGYDQLFWRMVEHVKASGGWATDGRSVNAWVRARAARYPSFEDFDADQSAARRDWHRQEQAA